MDHCTWSVSLDKIVLTKFNNLLRYICGQVHKIHFYSHRAGSCRVDQVDLVHCFVTPLFCTRCENNNRPCLFASPCGGRVFSEERTKLTWLTVTLVGRLHSDESNNARNVKCLFLHTLCTSA